MNTESFTNPKYPRTWHLPYSPGTTSDDKKMSGDWFSSFKNREIVITSKLDGENNAITSNDVFARSHTLPTRSSWTRNIWGKNGILWQIKDKIAENETVYGENLFAVHSIEYDKLPAYWYVFAVTNGKIFYSWDNVVSYAKKINQPCVPLLWRGIIKSEKQLKSLVEKFVNEPEIYGPHREGVVIRITDEFPFEDFRKYVFKWVRPNHIKTDKNWTKLWKQATLIKNTVEIT